MLTLQLSSGTPMKAHCQIDGLRTPDLIYQDTLWTVGSNNVQWIPLEILNGVHLEPTYCSGWIAEQ